VPPLLFCLPFLVLCGDERSCRISWGSAAADQGCARGAVFTGERLNFQLSCMIFFCSGMPFSFLLGTQSAPPTRSWLGPRHETVYHGTTSPEGGRTLLVSPMPSRARTRGAAPGCDGELGQAASRHCQMAVWMLTPCRWLKARRAVVFLWCSALQPLGWAQLWVCGSFPTAVHAEMLCCYPCPMSPCNAPPDPAARGPPQQSSVLARSRSWKGRSSLQPSPGCSTVQQRAAPCAGSTTPVSPGPKPLLPHSPYAQSSL